MYQTIDASDSNKNQWIILGWGYVFLFTTIAAYLNYIQPYDPTPTGYPGFGLILLWTGLYLPLLLPVLAHWEVKHFGFSVNPTLILASVLITGICAAIPSGGISWLSGLSEAFARTGEEFFFRGFVFLLLLKMFEKKKNPWIWAVMGSSIVFTLVHTQFLRVDSVATSQIVSRFVGLFISAVVLAAIRHWTKSILPGSIAHGSANGGILTLPFVLLIYAIITYWAYARKENVVSGFHRQTKVPA